MTIRQKIKEGLLILPENYKIDKLFQIWWRQKLIAKVFDDHVLFYKIPSNKPYQKNRLLIVYHALGNPLYKTQELPFKKKIRYARKIRRSASGRVFPMALERIPASTGSFIPCQPESKEQNRG